MKTATRKPHFTKTDLAACVVGLVLFAFFAVTARLGVGVHDEACFYSVPQRLLQGDRLLIDDWHMAQLGNLFHFIPYFIYTKIAGGTRGVILFFRYFYIVVNTVFCGWTYVKLRRWNGWGLFAAASFYVLVPGAFTGFNYHAHACMAVMLFCLLLFFTEPFPTGKKLVFAGVALACGVLAQPFLIFAFGAYFAAVLLRNTAFKNKEPQPLYRDVLSVRTFLFVTLGAFCMFVLTVLFLVRNGALRGLKDVLPYLFSGKEYNLSEFLSSGSLSDAVTRFGVVPAAGLLLCAVGAAVYRFGRKKSAALRRGLLFGTSVFLIASFGTAVYGLAAIDFADNIYHLLICHDFPLLLASFTVCLLCERPDPRCVLLWITGFLFTLCVDTSSYTLFATGGKICFVAGVLSVPALAQELRGEADPAQKKKAPAGGLFKKGPRRVLAVVCAAALVFTGLWNLGYLCAGGLFEPFEYVSAGYRFSRCTETLEDGPFKGLRTTGTIAGLYRGSLNDLKTVRAIAGDRPVLVLGCLPWMYLQLGSPYAAYTSYYLDEPERLLQYWQVLPERQPAVIYVPYYDYNYENPRYQLDEKIAEITNRISSYTSDPGESGYIITVTGSFVF